MLGVSNPPRGVNFLLFVLGKKRREELLKRNKICNVKTTSRVFIVVQRSGALPSSFKTGTEFIFLSTTELSYSTRFKQAHSNIATANK